MKAMKKITGIFNILLGIPYLLACIGQVIATLIIAMPSFIIGFFLGGGLALFALIGIFVVVVIFLEIIVVLVFGLILSKRKFANILTFVMTAVLLVLTVTYLFLSQSLMSMPAIVEIDLGELGEVMQKVTIAFVIVHSVMSFVFLLKLIFNKDILTKEEMSVINEKGETTVTKKNITKVFCSHCGTSNNPTQASCKSCGSKL